MIPPVHLYAAVVIALTSLVSGHASIWHPSMWGFNQSISDNRPQDPLMNRNFTYWWFHGHLDYPPHPEDIMQIPAGGIAPTFLSCDKDATPYWTSGPGGDQQSKTQPDYPCPGQPTTEFHTNGINDVGGCALAVAYKSNVSEVQPEDFAVFSVNQTCVWYMHTDFQVPAEMPPCPDGKCTCAWFWMHRPDSGSEQMYMNGFQCNFTNTISTNPVAPAKVPRRCGPNPLVKDSGWNYSNCTYGPQQPIYWLQLEGNNMFEDYYDTPLYLDWYNYRDGAQNHIFVNSSTALPASASNSSALIVNQTSSSSLSALPSASVLAALSPSNATSPSGAPAASSGTAMPMPGPSQPPSNLSNSSMPSSTNASATEDDENSCDGSGDMPGYSLPASSLPTTQTADATAQTPSAPGNGPSTPSGTGSSLPTASPASLDSDPAASNATVSSAVPSTLSGTAIPSSQHPSNSSNSATPSPTDASATDDEDDSSCSGDMPGSSLPASGTGSSLPTASALSLDSNPAASNATVPSGAPSNSSGTPTPGPSSSATATDAADPATQTPSNVTIPSGAPPASSAAATPGSSSSPVTDIADPAATSGSSKHHHHHWYHHYEHHGHGHQEKRSLFGEINGGIRRAWGAQRRHSAGKRQA